MAQVLEKPTCVNRVPVKLTLEKGKDYYWCSCGKSKNQPFCDGSHKGTKFTPIPIKGEGKEVYLCNCKRSDKKPFCDGTHKNDKLDW